MPHPHPRIQYFLSHRSHIVQPGDEIWDTSVPLSRQCFLDEEVDQIGIAVSYGDYFNAVHAFLEDDQFKPLTDAASKFLKRQVVAGDIDEIVICLEKHGEFYHPARVEVFSSDPKLPFVVNVAISEAGKKVMQKDFANIKKLNRRFPYPFLPDVYCEGETAIKNDAFKIRMFLGQWLDGYHEFHLSGNHAAVADDLVVWDPVQGVIHLTAEQRLEVYRQAAMILTAYYNLETFEQIFAWHHAAGDFVVKAEQRSNKIDVKLVTVRKYAPLFKATSADTETLFQALLLFLLNLSLRMRLDRLDGVGDMAWADDRAVAGTVQGFFDGLALQTQFHIIPQEIPTVLEGYLTALSADDTLDLLKAIVGRFPSQSPETRLITSNIENHATTVYRHITVNLQSA